MKRREFVRALTKGGCYLKRHGANHDLYTNPATGRTAPVPRHAEIRDTLARKVKSQDLSVQIADFSYWSPATSYSFRNCSIH